MHLRERGSVFVAGGLVVEPLPVDPHHLGLRLSPHWLFQVQVRDMLGSSADAPANCGGMQNEEYGHKVIFLASGAHPPVKAQECCS